MPPTAESESSMWVTDALYRGANKRICSHDSDGNSQGYESDIQRQRRIGHARAVDLDIEDKGKTIEMQVLWREPVSAEVWQSESHRENNDQKNGAYCSPDRRSPSALQPGWAPGITLSWVLLQLPAQCYLSYYQVLWHV